MKKASPTIHDVVRQPAKHARPRTGAASKTLMRQAVKRPAPSLSQRLKAQGPADLAAQQALERLAANDPWQRLEAKRLSQAKAVTKSQLVSHFTPIDVANKQVAFAAAAAPSPGTARLSQQAHTAPVQPASNPKLPQTTAEFLEHALQQATSHEQLPPKLPHKSRAKRRAGIGAGMALAAVLLVVAANQNLSAIRLQVASAKAGFSARLPDYQPAGFSQGALNYSSGVVASHFVSNSNGRGYTITQKASAWSSAELHDNFLVRDSLPYQAVQTNNRTIYLYGQGNATWVNNGVWYIIVSDGALSDHQLVKLASSF